MVIWFNNDKAREHLLKFGFVYTLRPKKRRVGVEPLFWKKQKKRGTVSVGYVGNIEKLEHIFTYSAQKMSGFSSLTEWFEAAKWSKYLYRVVLLELIE